jgi:guanylate kinase
MMLLLVSGPSGAGKSTFVKALLEADARVRFSVSTTTRPMRAGETDGVQYHFVNDDDFQKAVADGEFVEWANVHNHKYGTRHAHLQEMMDRGEIPLLDLDVQGGKNVIEIFNEKLVSVFIFPPSWDVLEKRLRARGTDASDVIDLRLENARWEIGYAKYYDYYIINDELDLAIRQMKSILTAEQCRRIRSASRIPAELLGDDAQK